MIKELIRLSIILFSLNTYLSGEENLPKQEIISDLIISNAQWKTPTNGTSPTLLSYDLEFNLGPLPGMSAHITPEIFAGQILPPHEFIQEGDSIAIYREDFILKDLYTKSDHSWFQLEHVQTGIHFDAQGPATKEILPLPEHPQAFRINHVKLIQEKGVFYILFAIKNTLVSLRIESDKYHGYYEGKPFLLIDESATPLDEFDRYRSLFKIHDLETGQTQEVYSLPMSQQTTIPNTKIALANVKINMASYHVAFVDYVLKFTFPDGNEYLSQGFTDKVGRSQVKYGYSKSLEYLGNEFMIINEKPNTSPSEDWRFSYFRLRSTKSGDEFEVYGPSRWPRNS